MSSYAPKHRAAPQRRIPAGARKTALTAGLAVTATGAAVASGLGNLPITDTALAADVAAPARSAQISSADLLEREQSFSRSAEDRRAEGDEAKAAALSEDSGAVTKGSVKVDLDSLPPQQIAKMLMPEYGLSASEFGCLDQLWISESDWDITADNPTSSAYGIPQGLTETHDMPAGYMTSAEVQIRWGLEYIKDSYGTACSAWDFKQGHNWY